MKHLIVSQMNLLSSSSDHHQRLVRETQPLAPASAALSLSSLAPSRPLPVTHLRFDLSRTCKSEQDRVMLPFPDPRLHYPVKYCALVVPELDIDWYAPWEEPRRDNHEGAESTKLLHPIGRRCACVFRVVDVLRGFRGDRCAPFTSHCRGC